MGQFPYSQISKISLQATQNCHSVDTFLRPLLEPGSGLLRVCEEE